jgi:hypothetical protein
LDILIVLLVLLLITAVLVAVVGHAFWLLAAWFFRQVAGKASDTPATTQEKKSCPDCHRSIPTDQKICACGWREPSAAVSELLKDLAATERQARRFFRAGQLDQTGFETLIAEIEREKEHLRSGKSPTPQAPANSKPVAESITAELGNAETSSDVVVGSFIARDDEIVIEPAPSFISEDQTTEDDKESAWSIPRPPRKSFGEMLNAFMEESNIRWGEIIGGLLIIGCSTALVVSLWSEISQIPVLKFLIFTTVTAALFGVGLYTEHRWKLPTTSRGILTTATLLVPLNFLAIAAVSSGDSPSALVVGSELIAPAIFLCLVYFAGKVLTPNWPHLLVAGVLGSSIGQLLVRHFASPDLSPGLLVLLGAFPLACYVASTVWMLKKALDDGEISESETIAVFITLGALTFAAVLPFALLLYKSGPIAMSMMFLAPLVSFGGFPLLATGMFLWHRVTPKKLVATRTVGTSLAILGTAIVVAGMILAWPNPASIVPSALFNFAVFTALALLLRLPYAHLPAALSFSLAYLVLVHVLAGNVNWQNLRVTSLLQESLSVSSGQALTALFVIFLGVSEWWRRRDRDAEGVVYVIAAGAIAAISLGLVSTFGLSRGGPFAIWFVYTIYAIGAFVIAWRSGWGHFSWIGTALLLAAAGQMAVLYGWSFPWQKAFFIEASLCAVAAIILRQQRADEKVLVAPLRLAALIASFIAVGFLIQAGPRQSTVMQTQAVFWLAGIWLLLLWLKPEKELFTLFQIALTVGVVLGIKATLQKYDWYSYLPHVFLHPWGLQIQGTALVLLSLIWVGLRFAFGRWESIDGSQRASISVARLDLIDRFKPLLNAGSSFDRLVLWCVLVAFLIFASFGALSGVTRELTAHDVANPSWDLAGFPHLEILQPGSWILLALILIALLANLWERRRSNYLVGAVAASTAVIPLLAGTWEGQTASAWRWLAALFLVVGSVALWYSKQIADWLKSFGWPSVEVSREELVRRTRLVLLLLTVLPVLVLTIYPAMRAIFYLPVHGPNSGFFSFVDEGFSYAVPLLVIALVLIAHAVRDQIPTYAFVAGFFFCITITIVHLLSVVAVNGSMNRDVLAQSFQLNAIVLAAYGLVWLRFFERWSKPGEERNKQETRRLSSIGFHHVAAIASLFLLGSIVVVRLLMRVNWESPSESSITFVLSLVSVVLLLIACLWDRAARYAVAGLYLMGMLFAGFIVDSLDLYQGRLLWTLMILVTVYSSIVAFIWHFRERILNFTDRWRLPRRIDESVAEISWLKWFQISAVVGCFLIAYWVVLFFADWPSRVTAALAISSQLIAFALMAEGTNRIKWLQAAIVVAVVGLVLFGWSFLIPWVTGTWLNRAVILMVEMFFVTALYALFMNRAKESSPDWTSAFQKCVPWIVGLAVLALLFSLSTEVFYQVRFGTVHVHPLVLLTNGLTLIAAMVLCVLIALSSTHDPLKLSGRGRMNYVYVAEVMLALLFMHVRLTMPWLFTGFFERYWPFVVMAIAYFGVATAESLRRRRLIVLAQPIERTGAFLPLLPVLGFWLAQSEVDYSVLLFVVGGLYGLLSVLRRSFMFGLVAAVAGNAGLWYLLQRSPDYQFLAHPQLWLIPVAMSVLIAAYLNEDDLSEEQMAGIRYLSLVTIYASSTADIFINGVAESPWLPLILAALSLAGVFCGIIFRIRGFLLLGSVFLLLSILTMIWYASANLGWTWLWYVAGIFTGATIIFMFAVFEKKRAEVLRLVEGLREWES